MIRLGDLRWVPWHSVGDRTDQVDGRLLDRNGQIVQQLDLWFIDGVGTDDLRSDQPELCVAARRIWDRGSVLATEYGVRSLLIPGAHFTNELVLTKRFGGSTPDG